MYLWANALGRRRQLCLCLGLHPWFGSLLRSFGIRVQGSLLHRKTKFGRMFHRLHSMRLFRTLFELPINLLFKWCWNLWKMFLPLYNLHLFYLSKVQCWILYIKQCLCSLWRKLPSMWWNKLYVMCWWVLPLRKCLWNLWGKLWPLFIFKWMCRMCIWIWTYNNSRLCWVYSLL